MRVIFMGDCVVSLSHLSTCIPITCSCLCFIVFVYVFLFVGDLLHFSFVYFCRFPCTYTYNNIVNRTKCTICMHKVDCFKLSVYLVARGLRSFNFYIRIGQKMWGHKSALLQWDLRG